MQSKIIVLVYFIFSIATFGLSGLKTNTQKKKSEIEFIPLLSMAFNHQIIKKLYWGIGAGVGGNLFLTTDPRVVKQDVEANHFTAYISYRPFSFLRVDMGFRVANTYKFGLHSSGPDGFFKGFHLNIIPGFKHFKLGFRFMAGEFSVRNDNNRGVTKYTTIAFFPLQLRFVFYL